MQLKRKHKVTSEVHASSMNDIMFFLMLFFLIVSTVTNPNVIKLLLPKSSTGQSVAKKTVNVSVTSDLKYYINKKPVEKTQLEAEIRTLAANVEETTVVLYVEKTVAIEDVVDIMDISNKVKVKLVLATDPK